MKNKIWLFSLTAICFILIFTFGCKKEDDNTDPIPEIEEPRVTDIDGNVYHTVTIGTQTWMLENLKVTHYRNGDPITHFTNSAQWQNLTTGAYINYDNNGLNGDAYGRLYNWYAVFDGPLLAPAGWHIPSKAEWQTLIDYLGGPLVAGAKLKEAGTAHWAAPNATATNESGFTALPAGNCWTDFFFLGTACYFWSSTENTSAWSYKLLINDNDLAFISASEKSSGLSVRCIKD